MAAIQAPCPHDSGKRHVHHSYIWLGGIRASFLAMLIFAVGPLSAIGSMAEDDPDIALAIKAYIAFGIIGAVIIMLIVFGMIFGIRALLYKNLFYELTQTELGVYSGIISKKRTHVPYQKIQSVDLKASLVQRIFGVCTVAIDTAGGAANKAVMIPYLQKTSAEVLRNDLYSLKSAFTTPATALPADASDRIPAMPSIESNVLDIGDQAWREFGGIFASPSAQQEQVPSFEYGLTNKEILLTGISNSSGVFAGIIGALVTGILTLIPTLIAIAERTSNAIGFDDEAVLMPFAESALAAIAPIAIGALIVLALVIWGIASLAACLQFGGFRARRRGTRIEVERGLLQHNAISLDIERVQSVIIKQSFIRRVAGYCEVSLGKVSAVEGASSNNDANSKTLAEAGFIIHPFVKLSKVEAILHGMVPEYADLPTEEVRVAPAALRRGLIRRCILFGGGFWLAVATAVIQAILHATVSFDATLGASEVAGILGVVDVVAIVLYALAAIILAFEIASTILWYRDSRFAKSKRMISLTNGGLSKSTVALPKTKVQFGTTKTNPLQRRAHTTTICATTAAGVGGTATTLIDVTTEVADAWMEWLEPMGQQPQRQA